MRSGYQFRYLPRPCVVCGSDPVFEEICGDDVWYFCEQHYGEVGLGGNDSE